MQLTSRLLRTASTFTYALLVLVTIFTVGLSCVLLLSQAVRNSAQRSWTRNFNALTIGAAYAIVLCASLVLCAKRRVAVRRRLQRISKVYTAIGRDHVPAAVHEYITQEYSRACLIAFESEPRNAIRPGWGKPGTAYEGVQYRRALLDTISEIDELARRVIPTLPPLKPHVRMIQHFKYILPLIPMDRDEINYLKYYDAAIQLARDLERELTDAEFESGMAAAQIIHRILTDCELEKMHDSTTQLNESVSQLSYES